MPEVYDPDPYTAPLTPTDVRGGPDIVDLAPDFIRQIPTSALDDATRQEESANFLNEGRRMIADKWLEVSRADLQGRAGEILGQAGDAVGTALDEARQGALSHLPADVATRPLNPLEVAGLGSTALNEATWKGGEAIHTVAPVIPTEAGAFAAGFAFGPFGKAETVGRAAMAADPILAAYNAAPRAGPTLGEHIPAVLQTIERLISDRFAAVNRISPEAEQLQSVFAGRTEGAFWRAVNDLGPVYRAIGDETVTLAPGVESTVEQQLNKFIGLNTYIENAAAKANPERYNPAGVKNVAEAQGALKAMEAQVGPDVWARIGQADDLRIQAMRGLLEDKVLAGLVPRDLADELIRIFPRFNPTVVTHFLDEAVAGGGSIRQMTNTLKRLTEKGSTSEQLPPLQAFLKNLMDGDLAIRRNTLLNTVVEDGGFPVRAAIKLTTGVNIAPEAEGALATVANRGARTVTDKALFMRDGKLMEADLPRDVADALNRVSTEQLGKVEQIAMGLNRSLRVGATQLNPAFLGANAARDYVSAFVREGLLPPEVMAGYAESATHGPLWQLAQRVGGGFGQAGSYYAKGTKYQPGETVAEVTKNLAGLEQKVKEAGGAVLHTPKDLAQFLDAVGTGDMGAVLKYFANPLRFGPGTLTDVGQAIEYGPRIATFAKHLQPAFEEAMGRKAANWTELAEWGSQQPIRNLSEAGMAMRRVTIDFNRAGELIRPLNAIAPFLNARVQGGLTMARTMRDNPGARIRAATIAAAAAGLYLYNRQFPEFKDVPAYLAENGFMALMLPGSEPNPNGLGYKAINFVTFPLGEYGVFTTGMQEALKAIDGTSGGMFDAMGKIVNAANPLPGAEGAAGVLPAPLRAYIEMQANWDSFRGRSIESESMKNLLPELRYGPRTPELVKDLGAFLADKPVPDMLKSPVMLEHLINTTTGGGGRLATQATSTLMGQEPDRPPVVGGLASTVYRTYGGEIESKAYADRDAALHDLTNQYRPMIKAIEENVGTGSVGAPPTTITLSGGLAIPLLPAEQAEYQKARLATIQEIFQRKDLDQRLKDVPVAQRKTVIGEVVSAANQVAEGIVVVGIGRDELRKRAIQSREPNPRKVLPQQEYSPVGAT